MKLIPKELLYLEVLTKFMNILFKKFRLEYQLKLILSCSNRAICKHGIRQ